MFPINRHWYASGFSCSYFHSNHYWPTPGFRIVHIYKRIHGKRSWDMATALKMKSMKIRKVGEAFSIYQNMKYSHLFSVKVVLICTSSMTSEGVQKSGNKLFFMGTLLEFWAGQLEWTDCPAHCRASLTPTHQMPLWRPVHCDNQKCTPTHRSKSSTPNWEPLWGISKKNKN